MALEKQVIEAVPVDCAAVKESQKQFLYLKKEQIRVRQRLGRPTRMPSHEVPGRQEGIRDGLAAMATILSSSMGRNRAVRSLLKRMPFGFLRSYVRLINRANSRKNDL
jgi:hypothetical protein